MASNGFTTITGADMVVYFGFREIYLNNSTGSPVEKARKYIWFDVGTVTQIRYASQKPAAPKYTVDNLNPAGISAGISITQGDMIFKNFNEDSINYILGKLKGELSEYYKIVRPVDYEEQGYAAIYEGRAVDEALSEADLEGFWSNEIQYWDEFPVFNIMVISKSSDYDTSGQVSKVMLKNVKVTDIGYSESTDSTEVNDIVKFIANSGVETWKEVAPTDTVGGVTV